MISIARLSFTLSAQLQSDAGNGVPWWVWPLAFAVLLFLFWYFFIRDESTSEPPAAAHQTRTDTTAPVVETDHEPEAQAHGTPEEKAPPVTEPPAHSAPEVVPPPVPEPQVRSAPEVVPPPVPQARPEAAPAAADDLRKIEGIGPKVSSLLIEAGIKSFAQLANTDVPRLQEILDAAGARYRIINPETWPEQASLAAAGDWDGLQTLQGTLQAGRRAA